MSHAIAFFHVCTVLTKIPAPNYVTCFLGFVVNIDILREQFRGSMGFTVILLWSCFFMWCSIAVEDTGIYQESG